MRLPPKHSIFACIPPTALPSALGDQVGLGVAAGTPLRVKEPHGASERTVSRFTVSNTVVFLGEQYIVLWRPSLSSLLFFSLRRLFSSHHDVSILQSAARQSKHWNDRSSTNNSTPAVQEALSPRIHYFYDLETIPNIRSTFKMELSPAFSINSEMTDEELDLYFAQCGSLSNLPTPPPAKEHTTIEMPVSTTSHSQEFATELQG